MNMEVELMTNVLGDNDAAAAANRELFEARGILAVDFLGSPGSGKTSILEQVIQSLDGMTIRVIEGDVATTNDARRIEQAGAEAFQINTGGMCHLNAPMIAKAIAQMDLAETDLLLIENVGNLVCPAAFELGAQLRMVVSSVTEGDDKPEKYPVAFRGCQGVVLNKIDLAPHVSFDTNKFWTLCGQLQPDAPQFAASCVTGEGIGHLSEWLREQHSQLAG
jgi:hydrogenase nickel incorporation protein HypB